MIKRRVALLLVLCLIVILFNSIVYSDDIISFNVNIFEGGRVDVVGNIPSGANKQVTFLVNTSNEPIIPGNIVYIDQVASEANGTFLFRFNLPETQQGATLDFKVGGEDAEAISKTLTIPDFPINISSVEDNSVRVGFDVYQLASPHYTADNVIDSIIEGGNTLYYRIGGNWYNLLDSRAKSAAFLIPTNAVNISEVDAWRLDTWYPRAGFDSLKFDPVSLD